MPIGESPNQTIKSDGQEIEAVDRFTYLGSMVDVNGGTNLKFSKDNVKNN